MKEMQFGMTRQLLNARADLKIRDEIRRTDSQHIICLNHVAEQDGQLYCRIRIDYSIKGFFIFQNNTF